jgi:deoxyribose-phosphate aldolase
LNQLNLKPFLDLTYLKDNTDELGPFLEAIKSLSEKPAGVCAYQRDLSAIKKYLGPTINYITVANFPSGNTTWPETAKEIERAMSLQVKEIDVVIPYQHYMQTQDIKLMRQFMGQCREAFPKGILKFILETGALTDHAIYDLSIMGAQLGADFIKTSTGKSAMGATLTAAKIIMQALNDHYELTRQRVGLKISGGLRSQEQVKPYIDSLQQILGQAWFTPATFRIGTSQVM